MLETILVIFVFFILLVSGFVFYTRFVKSGIEEGRYDSAQKRSIAVANKVMFLPEVLCSQDNSIREDCIDLIKLDSAKVIINANQLFYHDILEFSNVTITQVYPTSARWELYSAIPKGYKEKFITNVPVRIYDEEIDKDRFGILTVETFSK